MTEFFDFVYRDRQCSAPTDIRRNFLTIEVESLDAPNVIPAGSTKAVEVRINDPFHVTSVMYRPGA